MKKNTKKRLFGHAELSKPIVIVALIVLIGVTAFLLAQVRNKATRSQASYGYYPTPVAPPKPSVILSGRVAGTPVNKSTKYFTTSLTLTSGQSVELKWASSNVGTCSAPWLVVPKGTSTTSGLSVQGPITSKRTFNISCSGPYGTATSTLLINMGS